MLRRSVLLLALAALLVSPAAIRPAAAQLQSGPLVGGPQQGSPNAGVSNNPQGPQVPVIQGPGQGPGLQAGPGVSPEVQILPCPFEPLDQNHEAYLRQLLEYWESSTKQIERFHCSFTRWEFNVFGPKPDPNAEPKATTLARGEIKYELPDKGFVEVSAKWNYVAATPEAAERYDAASDAEFEKFITDGMHTYVFNFADQKVMKTELPPEMRGRTIADGPIPFVFGAEANKMLERYWIRVVTPPEAAEKGEYWLEAYPKFMADRAELHHVRVILDGQEFLPTSLEVYHADHQDSQPNFAVYKFEDRRKNPNNSLFIIQRRPFYEPSIPSGWQLVEQSLSSPEFPSAQGLEGQPRVGESPAGVNR